MENHTSALLIIAPILTWDTFYSGKNTLSTLPTIALFLPSISKDKRNHVGLIHTGSVRLLPSAYKVRNIHFTPCQC